MNKWYKIALFNLVVLALLELLLRYKINFPLKAFRQENLLHAHSHFAFNGWVGFLLQLIILGEFTGDYKRSPRFWDRFFLASTMLNYAMIASFAASGYSVVSITFTTASLLVYYIFAYKIQRTIVYNTSNKTSVLFIKLSLFFLVLSSLGPYALAVIAASKGTHQYWYHNALYFFLHFQYNGWFTFAVLGLLMKKLERSPVFEPKVARICCYLLAATCIPSYFFTSLWHHRPVLIDVIIMITAVLQTTALFFLWRLLRSNVRHIFATLPVICQWLYSLAIAAFILKIGLQFFSVHPDIAQLAFGFRPIIIGYLHLIFLAFVSMYLLGFMADSGILPLHYRLTRAGLIIFPAGIILNEVLLAIQGLAAIYYLYLPYINIALFINTLIMFAGALLLLGSVKNTAGPACRPVPGC